MLRISDIATDAIRNFFIEMFFESVFESCDLVVAFTICVKPSEKQRRLAQSRAETRRSN